MFESPKKASSDASGKASEGKSSPESPSGVASEPAPLPESVLKSESLKIQSIIEEEREPLTELIPYEPVDDLVRSYCETLLDQECIRDIPNREHRLAIVIDAIRTKEGIESESEYKAFLNKAGAFLDLEKASRATCPITNYLKDIDKKEPLTEEERKQLTAHRLSGQPLSTFKVRR